MSGSGNWPHRQNTAASRNWETRTAQRRQRRRSPLSDERVVRIALFVGMALVIGAGIWSWSSRKATADDTRPAIAVTAAQPAATPTLAPAPTPTTAAAANATIVRLGGGPGMLHEAPGFNTPVLSIILKEGDTVELLDRRRRDTDGNVWRLVAFGDSVGWSPENNLEAAP